MTGTRPHDSPSKTSNRLVLALWAFGIMGTFFLLREAWPTPLNERDFVAVWVAGKLAAAGHVAQVYDTETLRAIGPAIGGSTVVKLAYPYPPHFLFVAVPLSLLPESVAFVIWQAVSGALFYIAARPYCPPGFPRILVLLTPAALINVLFGQVGLFFGSLWLFAFGGSAVAAAILTFKPHLGLLVAVEAARKRRLLITSAIAIAILGLSAVVFGVDAWRAWFLGAATHQLDNLAVSPEGIWQFQMVTPYLAYGLVGWLLFAGASVALLFRRFDVFTAATGAFLIAPYGFHYDMSVVCLGFGLLLFQRWRDMPAWQTFICAIAFLLPLVVALGTWIASPILLAGLYVQVRNPIERQKGGLISPERSELAATV